MTPPQLQLPAIRVSDIEVLTDWDFEHVKAFGDSIPGFRSSSSECICPCCLTTSLISYPPDIVNDHGY